MELVYFSVAVASLNTDCCISFFFYVLDFGMMGEFRQELRDGFIQACLHMVNRDFDALSNDFITLG